MTGREWQTAFYVRDRWRPNEKLTVNAGLRLEYFPLMTRATHGIEVLDYNTYMVSIGGLGGVPQDAGLKLQNVVLGNPVSGASYRLNEKMAVRAGYGLTRNPLPWSRPMRGSFPYDINNNRPPTRTPTHDAGQRHPGGRGPRLQPGPGEAACRRLHAVPQHGREAFPGSGSGLDRAKIQQWNIAFERKMPGDIAVEVAYVGTRDRRRVRGPERQLRRAGRRQRVAQVLRVGRHDRHQRLGGANQGALQGLQVRSTGRSGRASC